MPGQFFDGFRLKRDESVGKFEGLFCGRICVAVPVHIRSGQGQKQRSSWVCITKANDGIVASPSVEGDETVGFAPRPGFKHAHTMPQNTEDACPAQSRDPVSVP